MLFLSPVMWTRYFNHISFQLFPQHLPFDEDILQEPIVDNAVESAFYLPSFTHSAKIFLFGHLYTFDGIRGSLVSKNNCLYPKFRSTLVGHLL